MNKLHALWVIAVLAACAPASRGVTFAQDRENNSALNVGMITPGKHPYCVRVRRWAATGYFPKSDLQFSFPACWMGHWCGALLCSWCFLSSAAVNSRLSILRLSVGTSSSIVSGYSVPSKTGLCLLRLLKRITPTVDRSSLGLSRPSSLRGGTGEWGGWHLCLDFRACRVGSLSCCWRTLGVSALLAVCGLGWSLVVAWMTPDTMSGGAVPVLEDIRSMTEILVFCASITAASVVGIFLNRLTRGR